jgi:hypothetical protein
MTVPRRLLLCLLVTSCCLTMGCPAAKSPPGPPVQDPRNAVAGNGFSQYNVPLPAGTQPWFEDRATALGINFKMGHNGKTPLKVSEVMGPGCAVCDLDGDGHADILIVGQTGTTPGGRCALYRNNGDGTFKDVTAGSGLEAPGMYMGVAIADIDNDGKPDIVITGFGVVKLFRNLGHCKFQDITKGSGLEAKSPTDWATSAAFADVDRDGLVDLYIGRYVVFNDKSLQFCDYGIPASCGPIFYDPQIGSLYKNLGHGKFKDISQAWGLDAKGKCLGVAFADVNNDGWPDLFLANDEMPGDLFINEKGRKFHNIGTEAGVALSGSGQMQGAMGVDFGDYNRDGNLDLFVTTYEFEPASLYRNTGGGMFGIVSAETGIGPPTTPFVGFGTKFLDVQNRGWLDIAIVNGHIHDNQEKIDKLGHYKQPMQLFMNEDGKTFIDRTREAGPGFTTPAVGRGLAIGDLNDDGLEDIVVTDIEGPVRVLMNRSTAHSNWLRISLEGTKSNRMGLGARVTLTAGGQTWIKEATTGGSYLSASDPRVHFGLGSLNTVDKVEVRWPSGRQSVVLNPHVPGDLKIREPL